MKATTLIPVKRNDGSEVSQAELSAIFARFYEGFGGCTIDGRTTGFWMDDGKLYQDECIKLFVVCDESKLVEIEQMVRDVGQQLGQLAMFLEVDSTADIRILRI